MRTYHSLALYIVQPIEPLMMLRKTEWRLETCGAREMKSILFFLSPLPRHETDVVVVVVVCFCFVHSNDQSNDDKYRFKGREETLLLMNNQRTVAV